LLATSHSPTGAAAIATDGNKAAEKRREAIARMAEL
jgi:hypothetical protein